VRRRAWLVRNQGHVVPVGWPRDVVTDCGECDSDKPHARNVCCNSMYRGEKHTGELELVCWTFRPPHDATEEDEPVGMFGILLEEADDMQEKFEGMGWDYAKMFEYWDRAFRWTCCGGAGRSSHGCDHHGSRGRCSCDFCAGLEFGTSSEVARYAPTAHNRLLCAHPEATDPDNWDTYRGLDWSPATHWLFPRALRAQIRTVLLARAQAAGTGFILGRLPMTVLEHVFAFIAGPSDPYARAKPQQAASARRRLVTGCASHIIGSILHRFSFP
jgi:hypothetical protein